MVYLSGNVDGASTRHICAGELSINGYVACGSNRAGGIGRTSVCSDRKRSVRQSGCNIKGRERINLYHLSAICGCTCSRTVGCGSRYVPEFETTIVLDGSIKTACASITGGGGITAPKGGGGDTR